MGPMSKICDRTSWLTQGEGNRLLQAQRSTSGPRRGKCLFPEGSARFGFITLISDAKRTR